MSSTNQNSFNGDGSKKQEDRQVEPLLINLPEEILEMIFSYLNQAEDRIAVSGSNAQFHRILTRGKEEWMFGKIFPLIFPHLDGGDILSCRLVCKKWNRDVDGCIQSCPVVRTLEPYPYHPTEAICFRPPPSHSLQYQPSLVTKGLGGLTLADTSVIEKFMADMKTHPRNPFVLPFLDLANDPGDDAVPDVYWTGVYTILSTFGHHILQVHLGPYVPDDNRNAVLCSYKLIRQALQYMPNLKILTIGGFECFRCFHINDFEKLTELEIYIRANPLPELPHLHTFESTVPALFKTQPVTDELIRRYSGQLQKLYMSVSAWKRDEPDHIRFPELTELQIGAYSTSRKCSFLLRSLRAPQLRKLFVIFWEPISMLRILKSLHDNLSSLEYLKLRFNARPVDYDILNTSEFTLENIKTLEIIEGKLFAYNTLLTHLPNLEYILICSERDQQVCLSNDPSEFRTCIYTNKVYGSSIWTKLKSLKDITHAWLGEAEPNEDEIVSKTRYTRDMYEFLKKRNSSGN